MLLPFLKTAQRRNNFIGFFFALFFVIIISTDHIEALYAKVDPISDKVALENLATRQPVESKNDLNDNAKDFYVPAIALIKTGVLNPGGGGVQPCTIIDYTYYITNESSATDEVLENVALFDPSMGGFIAGPDSGDGGIIGLLEDGETWIYTAQYNITPADKVAASAGSGINATVTATVQGSPIQVNDNSDDNSILEDDPTITDLGSCDIKIGLIKEGVLNQGTEFIEPCTTIDYTYKITNQSTSEIPLELIRLNDPLQNVNNIAINSPDGDDGDNFLEIGEEWRYTISYTITSVDRILGHVDASQATVQGNPQGGGPVIYDDSDDDDYFEDDITRTDISACQPAIGLVKTSIENPGGLFTPCTLIEYTFTVTNESPGGETLESVVLRDPLLGGIINDSPTGDTGNDDKLEASEVWEYKVTYNITQTDRNAGEVQNQAEVTADISAGTGETVTDFSHPADVDADANTITDLSGCQTRVIEMLLTAAPLVDTDADGCPDAIDYTYTVRNSGNVDLNITALVDDLGNSIALPSPNTDDLDDDGFLDVGEQWIYTSRYDITQNDIDNSPLDNQATISSEIVGSLVQLPDELSHETDFFSAGLTSVDVSDTCFDTVAIGLTKIDTNFIDSDLNGCDDQIEYTITVENLGGMNLDVTYLYDEQLDIITAGPFTESMTPDGILEINETWDYTDIYNITQFDVNDGSVSGLAEVIAQPVGTTVDILANDALVVPIPWRILP